MTDNRKVQIPITGDATGFKQAAAEVKAEGRDLAQSLQQSAQAAATAVDGIGNGAGGAAQKFDAATRNIANAIQRTSAAMKAGEKGTADFYDALGNIRGADMAALRPLLDDLRRLEAAQKAANGATGAGKAVLNEMGMSARQTAFALRQVPAQFTDIVTSLASGQRPMQVLIQQGGQLKDVFGGIGPAARALGGYVAGLVNPFTIAAAVIGGLAYAADKGAEELRGFQNAVTITGNAIGRTNSEFSSLRDSISEIATKGKAAEVLTAIAASGLEAGQNVREIAEAAILMEKATGQAVSKTLEQFKDLAKSPADAAAKLNEQYNFLTASVYRQIKALEDQGKASEAANLAERTYAQELATRSKSVVDNAGWMEKAWRGLSGAAKGAWDAILNVGRESSNADQIGILQRNLDERRTRNRSLGIGDANGDTSMTRDVMLQIDLLRENERMEKRLAESQAERARVTRQTVEWEKEGEKFLSKQELQQRELNKAKVEGQALINAGIITEAQLRQRLAGIRDKYKETGAAGTGESEVAGVRARIQAEQQSAGLLQDRISNLNFTDPAKVTEAERQVLKLQEELKTSISGVARAQKEKALAEAQSLVAAEKTTQVLQKQYDAAKKSQEQLDRLAVTTGDQADTIRRNAEEQEAANATYGKSKTAIEEMVLAQLRLQSAEADSSDTFDPRYVASLNAKVEAQERYVRSLKDAEKHQFDRQLNEGTRASQEEAATLQLELSLVGQTQEARERIVGQRRVEVALAKELAEIDRSGMTDADKEAAREKARVKARIDGENAANKAVLNEWQRTADSINQSLTDALLRGFESGKDFAQNLRDTLKNMFSTLVLRPMIQGVMAPMAGAFGGITGGSAGIPGGQSAGGGGLGDLLSLGSTIGGSMFGAGGLSGALSAGAGWLTGATTLSGSLTAAGSLIGAGGSGILSGLAMGAGALGPIALGAFALYSILNKKKGGPKSEGFFNPYNSDRYYSSNGAEAMGASRTQAQALQAQYDAVVGAYGGAGGLQFGVGYSTDPKGDAASQVHVGIGRNGQALANLSNTNVGRSEEDLAAAIAEQGSRAVLLGLQQSNIGGQIGQYLASLGDVASLAAEKVTEAITKVQKAAVERQTLEDKLYDLTHSSLEKVNRAREREREALDETNRELYDHVARLTDLTETLAAQRDTLLQAYQSESSELQGVVSRHTQFAKQLRELRDSLTLSEMPLSRAQRSQRASSVFGGTLSSAIAGNEDALQGLGGAGQAYIEAIRQSARTPAEIAAAVARVQAGLTTAASASEGRATTAQQQLDAMTQQLTALGLLNTSLLSVGDALAAYLRTQAAIQQETLNYTAAIAAQKEAATTPAPTPTPVTPTSSAPQPTPLTFQEFIQRNGGINGSDDGETPFILPYSQYLQLFATRGFAGGGLASGTAMVGEVGPEIVDFDTPGRVYTNEQTKGMFASNAELAPLLSKVATLLEGLRQESRIGDAATVAALQKLVTKVNKWDAIGMPMGEDMTA